MSTELRDALDDSFERIVQENCGATLVREIEAGGDASTLWHAMEATGFPDALVSESAGGSGLALADALAIPILCGRYAVPVPVSETMLLRGLIAGSGLPVPQGSLTMAKGVLSSDGGLSCSEVQLGRIADRVIVDTPDGTFLLERASAVLNRASFALDANMEWQPDTLRQAPRLTLDAQPELAQAFICAAQLSGALLTVFQASLDFANTREQFGRAIGKFQAIQHQLALMAEHVFAARMAVELSVTTGITLDPMRVGVAKARASEAAVAVAAMAHAVHGAIGFTEEFDLQLLTRRLHNWRRAAGSESHWQARLGAALIADECPASLDFLRKLSAAW